MFGETSAFDEALAFVTLPKPAECRRIRERAGLSQVTVGAALGVTDVAVARYELGQRTPRGDLLVRYSRLLSSLRALAESAEAQR